MYVQQTISKTYPRTAERKWETRKKTDVNTDEIDKCNLLNVNVWIKRSSKEELHSLSIDFRWPYETIHFISFDFNIPMNCYNANHRSTKAPCQRCSPIITNNVATITTTTDLKLEPIGKANKLTVLRARMHAHSFHIYIENRQHITDTDAHCTILNSLNQTIAPHLLYIYHRRRRHRH